MKTKMVIKYKFVLEIFQLMGFLCEFDINNGKINKIFF